MRLWIYAIGHMRGTPEGMLCEDFCDRARKMGRNMGFSAVALTGSIVVDAGPTAYALAMELSESFRGSVITHSVPVLHLLDERLAFVRTVALGGEQADLAIDQRVHERERHVK